MQESQKFVRGCEKCCAYFKNTGMNFFNIKMSSPSPGVGKFSPREPRVWLKD